MECSKGALSCFSCSDWKFLSLLQHWETIWCPLSSSASPQPELQCSKALSHQLYGWIEEIYIHRFCLQGNPDLVDNAMGNVPKFSTALVQNSIFWCKLAQWLVRSTFLWVQSPLPQGCISRGEPRAGADWSLSNEHNVSICETPGWRTPRWPVGTPSPPLQGKYCWKGWEGQQRAKEATSQSATTMLLFSCSFGGTLHKNPQ